MVAEQVLQADVSLLFCQGLQTRCSIMLQDSLCCAEMCTGCSDVQLYLVQEAATAYSCLPHNSLKYDASMYQAHCAQWRIAAGAVVGEAAVGTLALTVEQS